MQVTQTYLDGLSYKIIGCAIEVHKHLGPGLLESVYEKCFARELTLRSISFRKQEMIEIVYKGVIVDADLRCDLLVEDLIIVELKATEGILPVHEAQLLSYMKLSEKPTGLLINFYCTNIFKEGQKTFVNDLYAALPKS